MNKITRPRQIAVILLAVAFAALMAVASATAGAGGGGKPVTLTLLHNNDGESQLIDAGSGIENYGGVARFATTLSREKAKALEQVCRTTEIRTLSDSDSDDEGPRAGTGNESAEGGNSEPERPSSGSDDDGASPGGSQKESGDTSESADESKAGSGTDSSSGEADADTGTVTDGDKSDAPSDEQAGSDGGGQDDDECRSRSIRTALFVSSGDNFLAGPEFNASLNDGIWYDARALDWLGYDAIELGNHDFDFGPDLLADFIGNGFKWPGMPPYLASNLVFTNEPNLQALADAGVILRSTVVWKNGARFGIVGAITPELPFISSPRNTIVLPNVAKTIQDEIDKMEAAGVNKIIVISHLQDIDTDIALGPLLSGVDVMVAGGGDEVLANKGDLLVPGDAPFGPYPMLTKNAEGHSVPVVTTAGDYKYLGRLEVKFDGYGRVRHFEGGPIRIGNINVAGGVLPNKRFQRYIVDPVSDFVEGLAANIIATSEVALEGRRDPGVRTMETNLGNLMADSQRWQGTRLAGDFGVPVPDVGLQNGGGIRNNSLIPAGPISELDTFSIAPFGNFVSIVPNIPHDQFRQIIERAVSAAPSANGRYVQVSGFSFSYDTSQTAQTIKPDGSIDTPGARVRELKLDGGLVIVSGGVVQTPAATLTVATIDFLARGGDGYPFLGAPFTSVGVSYQQALSIYIQAPTGDGGLGGTISSADYPEGGEGRITDITP